MTFGGFYANFVSDRRIGARPALIWYAVEIAAMTRSLTTALALPVALTASGCGAPSQLPAPPPQPSVVASPAPANAGPAPSTTNDAATPPGTAAPDPSRPRPLHLAAEQGVPLGSAPSALVDYCTERAGKVVRSVTSNRGFVHCRELPPPMIEALAWYCGEGLSEAARLCRIVQTSQPVSTSEAGESHAFWTRMLAAHFGPPTEQTADDTVWTTDRQRVSTFSERDKQTSQHTTSVVYESVEDRPPSGQPEFPTRIGDFELGLTRAEAKHICKRQRGRFVDVKYGGARGFICVSLKGESPLAFSGTGGLYCGDRLCELWLVLSESSRRALLLMSATYGDAPPRAAENPRCGADAKSYTWRWSRDEELVGMVRLVDDCSPVVYYDNAEGWTLRAGSNTGVSAPSNAASAPPDNPARTRGR